MPGLIPLMLNAETAGTRRSVVYSPGPQSATSPSDTPVGALQRLSCPGLPTGTQRHPVAPHRLSARFSAQPAPAALSMLPYTPAEWAKAVSEVKRLYLNRRYRPCSARCSAILDSIKDTSNVEPAYLIYLHFYAAISMEMSTRSLHHTSPHRSTLLRQAETHYTRAADLIQSEDVSLQRFSRTSSSSSATASSVYSPNGSVGSRASTTSTTSTRLSSPTSSLCGADDRLPSALRSSMIPSPSSSAATPAAKKRVTFSDPPPDPGPLIRPDSPTLGFDEWVAAPREVSKPEPLLPLALLRHRLSGADEDPGPEPEQEPEQEQEQDGRRSFLRYSGLFFPETSTDRYSSILAGLLSQVNLHLASVRADSAGDDASPSSGRSTPESSSSSSSSSSTTPTPRSPSSPCPTEEGEEDMRARIDRLRRSGWRRRRFDAGRYRALRESVLAELG